MIRHIYGAIAIFLLFYDDQDTSSAECEIYMTISQLIFTIFHQALYRKIVNISWEIVIYISHSADEVSWSS